MIIPRLLPGHIERIYLVNALHIEKSTKLLLVCFQVQRHCLSSVMDCFVCVALIQCLLEKVQTGFLNSKFVCGEILDLYQLETLQGRVCCKYPGSDVLDLSQLL